MSFFDADAYAEQNRTRNVLPSGLTTGLAFNATGELLAALTTSGHLAVHALPRGGAPSAPSAPSAPHASTLLRAPARALAPAAAGLYAACADGLLVLDWRAELSRCVADDLRVRALAPLRGGFVAAAAQGGWVAVVDEARGEPAEVVGGEAPVACLAPLAAEKLQFVAGCEDGAIRQYDCRAMRTAVRTTRLKGRGAISCLGINDEGSFVMAGDAHYGVSTLHLHSSSVVSTTSVPFRPQAAVFTKGLFYCGGSDRASQESARYLHVYDFQCNPAGAGTTPVSARGVYALAVHPESGVMAAGGYCPQKSEKSLSGEMVDVYVDPPVRSFSFAV